MRPFWEQILSQSTSGQSVDSIRTSTDSTYSANETVQAPHASSRTATRTATRTAPDVARSASVFSQLASRLSSYRTASPLGESEYSRSHTVTPTASSRNRVYPAPHERQASFASAVSDYRTTTPSSPPPVGGMPAPFKEDKPKLVQKASPPDGLSMVCMVGLDIHFMSFQLISSLSRA